jgi:excinuclease UvrABC helicase subunit UvrB
MIKRKFKLISEFSPAGDQPKAIANISAGINSMERDQ